jgi:hypothetical protein
LTFDSIQLHYGGINVFSVTGDHVMKKVVGLAFFLAILGFVIPVFADAQVFPQDWKGDWKCWMNGAPRTLSINKLYQSKVNKDRKWVRGALKYPNGNKRLLVQRQYKYDGASDIRTDKPENVLPLWSYNPAKGESDPGKTRMMLIMHNGDRGDAAKNTKRFASGYYYYKKTPYPVHCRKGR